MTTLAMSLAKINVCCCFVANGGNSTGASQYLLGLKSERMTCLSSPLLDAICTNVYSSATRLTIIKGEGSATLNTLIFRATIGFERHFGWTRSAEAIGTSRQSSGASLVLGESPEPVPDQGTSEFDINHLKSFVLLSNLSLLQSSPVF